MKREQREQRREELWSKAQPLFDQLEAEGRIEKFNPADWLKDDSEAGKFLQENFSKEECKNFRDIVIAQLALSVE
ncbi:MAG: hypothetical protein OEV93_03755 [Candidatus Moranbacteria bacterium]|nr:hypothetical protein [Candidatus Moranbacteria bacterium]